MSKLDQPRIPLSIDTWADMIKSEDQPQWMLTRLNDGLVKKSKAIIWIEWNEDGTFKAKHDDIAVGRSLLMSPFNQFFTWQTTTVTQITAATPDSEYIEFSTTNSKYRLNKMQ